VSIRTRPLHYLALWALLPLPVALASGTLGARVAELHPTGEVTADGHTPVMIEMVVLEADGSPVEGLVGKLTAASGRTTELEALGQGRYRSVWTPSLSISSEPVRLTLSGKTPDKQKVKRAWNFQAMAPLEQSVNVQVSPVAMTLGVDNTATLTVKLQRGAMAGVDTSNLLVAASVGTIANLTPMGDGKFIALYTPPPGTAPQLVHFTVADRRDPTAAVGHAALPLFGRVDATSKVAPLSATLFKVGGREYGPVDSDKKGVVTVSVEVKPGVAVGEVISLGDGTRSEAVLAVPPMQQVVLVPPPTHIPADPAAVVILQAYVAAADGAPDLKANVVFTTDAGSVTNGVHQGAGRYIATLTPALGAVARETAISVAVMDPAGQSMGAQDQRLVQVVPVRPASVAIRTVPEIVPAEGGALAVTVDPKGPNGLLLPGRSITLVASGARCPAAPKEEKDGTYNYACTVSGKGPVDLRATVQTPGGTNPVARILAVPAQHRVPADGLSAVNLTILALDSAGYPVADVPMELGVTQGDGSIPTKATTDSNGLALLTYTAGRTPGAVYVGIGGGGRQGAVGFFQLPPDMAPGLSLPPTGTQETAALVAAWAPSTATLRVERAP
jgi:Bacterial Ig-like domain (group 1)